MKASDFDEMVEQAYRRVPARFRRRMQNIAVIVEAEASPQQLRSARVPSGSTLLGLYEGRPLIHRSVSEPFAMPDRITIFQRPLEEMARDRAHLAQLIADTLWHEIAHYFGMDERQVRTAERRRARRDG